MGAALDLLRIIRSIEELLYELTSWLIFYPRTLWAAIRHPFATMAHVAREERETTEDQFSDGLSPPLLLFITILLAHGIELSSVGLGPAPSRAVAALFASEQFLLLFRALLFSLFPLLGAAAAVRARGTPMTRATLRSPFFSLCIIAAPFALLSSIGLVLARARFDGAGLAGAALILGSSLLYLALQAMWMKRTLPIGPWRAAWLSLLSFAQAVFYLLVVVLALAQGATA